MSFTPQISVGFQRDLDPVLGAPHGSLAECETAFSTTAIPFGEALEYVSASAKTAKIFDGTGTIIGFAVKENRQISQTGGYAANEPMSVLKRGRMWVKAGAVLTVGAAYPGVANSEVKAVSTIGAQNIALVDVNIPALGPAL